MFLQTKSLRLVPHIPAHLLALIESEAAYEKLSGIRLAQGVREFLLAGSPDFMVQLRAATAPDPWRFGFAVVHKIDNVMIGMSSFTGPPDSNAVAEIAYGIAPAYQGKGYASEAAVALVDFASQNGVATVCAHTLPEVNSSTRVLEKCGFKKTDEIIDGENNLVWRWERKTLPGSTSTS